MLFGDSFGQCSSGRIDGLDHSGDVFCRGKNYRFCLARAQGIYSLLGLAMTKLPLIVVRWIWSKRFSQRTAAIDRQGRIIYIRIWFWLGKGKNKNWVGFNRSFLLLKIISLSLLGIKPPYSVQF